jgi:hypothetical protein
MQHIGYREVQAAVVVVVSLDVTSLPLLATTTRSVGWMRLMSVWCNYGCLLDNILPVCHCPI